VLSAMMSNDLFGRPTNYQESLAAKYRSYTAASLDQAIRDAETHAEEDRRRRELVELRNGGDQLVYATEKLLKEHGSGISEATRQSVSEKLEALKKVLTSDDISLLRNAIDALNKEAQKIGVEMYGKGGPTEAPPPGSGDSSGSPGPGVVDADFEDVDKK